MLMNIYKCDKNVSDVKVKKSCHQISLYLDKTLVNFPQILYECIMAILIDDNFISGSQILQRKKTPQK